MIEEFREKEYNYIYKITNKINNKIYIGMHSTDDLEDGYMGSSKELIKDIRIYGRENFEKEILEFYDCRDSLRKAEARIVDQNFINREDTYNDSLGGMGGDSYSHWKFRQTQEFKDFIKNLNVNTFWVTDGISENRRIKEGDEVPEGFHKGLTQFAYNTVTKDSEGNIIYSRNLEYMNNKDYLRSIGKGSKWINNGEKEFRLLEGEILPEGFQIGRIENPNKDKKWIFNREKNIFKMVREPEVSDYLAQGWELESPASKLTGSNFSKRVENATRAKGEKLLESIKEKGIDIINSGLSQKEKIRQIIDSGLLSKKVAYKTLTRLLPEYFHKNTKGTTWITDGINNKKYPVDQPIPEGWRKGTTIRQGPNKNLK